MLSDKANITKKSADNFVRLFFSTIEENLLADRYVKIKDFGAFKLVTVSERESVNVATGERFQIGSHSKVSFTAEGLLRDKVNMPFAHFTSVEISDEVSQEDLDAITLTEAAQEAAPQEKTAPVEEPQDAVPSENSELAEEAEVPAPAAEEATEKEAEVPAIKTEDAAPTETAEGETAPTETAEEETQFEDTDQETESTQESEETMDTPNAPQQTIIIQKEPAPTNWWKVAFISLIVAGLVVASYYAGYNRIFSGGQADAATSEQVDSTSQKRATSAPAQKKADEAHKAEAGKKNGSGTKVDTSIPQLPDSEFRIIGTRTIHEFKTGESLRSLSIQYYGSIDKVKYIVFFNNIKNPDVVALGAKIAIPELIKND